MGKQAKVKPTAKITGVEVKKFKLRPYIWGGECEDENCVSQSGSGLYCDYCIERRTIFCYCPGCGESEIPRRRLYPVNPIEQQKKWRLTYRVCPCGERLCDECWQSNINLGEFRCSLTPRCADINRMDKEARERDKNNVSLSLPDNFRK